MLHMPEGVASLDAAAECIELAEHYGPPRDDAQKITLQAWMGTQADSRWAAAIAAHAMSRQNGKGDEIEDRELYGLLILGEAIVHTAHEVATARFCRNWRAASHRSPRWTTARRCLNWPARFANAMRWLTLPCNWPMH